jgi:hypothetical protein
MARWEVKECRSFETSCFYIVFKPGTEPVKVKTYPSSRRRVYTWYSSAGKRVLDATRLEIDQAIIRYLRKSVRITLSPFAEKS